MAISTFRSVVQAPLSSIMTVFAIAVALLLPALLLIVNANFVAVLDEFRESAQLTLYLTESTSEAEGQELSEDLLTREELASVEYISRARAMADFENATGFTDLLASLADNPLPAAIVVSPTRTDSRSVSRLREQLQQLPQVALVQVDEQWLQRLDAIARLLTALARVLGLIVLLGLGFIVGNTIRLAVENRRAEIRVMKLVGGTNAFIARPFLYTGLYFGTAGGLLATVLVGLISLAIRDPLQALTGLATSSGFEGLGLTGALQLVGVGAAVGWTAALIASWRTISGIDAD